MKLTKIFRSFRKSSKKKGVEEEPVEIRELQQSAMEQEQKSVEKHSEPLKLETDSENKNTIKIDQILIDNNHTTSVPGNTSDKLESFKTDAKKQDKCDEQKLEIDNDPKVTDSIGQNSIDDNRVLPNKDFELYEYPYETIDDLDEFTAACWAEDAKDEGKSLQEYFDKRKAEEIAEHGGKLAKMTTIGQLLIGDDQVIEEEYVKKNLVDDIDGLEDLQGKNWYSRITGP